jgi:hypothetical protein
MTNHLTAGTKIRMAKGGLANEAKMEPLELPRSVKRIRKTVIIGLLVAAVIVGIESANPLIIIAAHHYAVTSKQCLQTPVKMFDENNVPKYFIGLGYKITPLDPKVTEVMIPICK